MLQMIQNWLLKSFVLRHNYATSIARMQQHLPGCKVLPGSVLQLCMLCMLVHGLPGKVLCHSKVLWDSKSTQFCQALQCIGLAAQFCQALAAASCRCLLQPWETLFSTHCIELVGNPLADMSS